MFRLMKKETISNLHSNSFAFFGFNYFINVIFQMRVAVIAMEQTARHPPTRH